MIKEGDDDDDARRVSSDREPQTATATTEGINTRTNVIPTLHQVPVDIFRSVWPSLYRVDEAKS